MASDLECIKQPFFNKNAEALTEMKRIIDTNPDTWPQVIKAQYGIIIDEHFWENIIHLAMMNISLELRNGFVVTRIIIPT